MNDQQQIRADALTDGRVTEAAAIPDGWKLVRVNEHFDALIAALERAESKGYLPDSIREEWTNFACDENVPQPAQADAQDVPADDLVGFVYVLENPDRPHDPITRFSRRPRSMKGLGAKIISLTPVYSRPAQADARVGLTDEQILECATRRVPTREVPKIPELAFSRSQFVDVVRALLAAHPGTGD